MYQDLKSLSLTSNAKLIQIGECQTGIAEIPGLTHTADNYFLNDFFYIPRHKPLIPILPFLFNYEITRIKRNLSIKSISSEKTLYISILLQCDDNVNWVKCTTSFFF